MTTGRSKSRYSVVYVEQCIHATHFHCFARPWLLVVQYLTQMTTTIGPLPMPSLQLLDLPYYRLPSLVLICIRDSIRHVLIFHHYYLQQEQLLVSSFALDQQLIIKWVLVLRKLIRLLRLLMILIRKLEGLVILYCILARLQTSWRKQRLVLIIKLGNERIIKSLLCTSCVTVKSKTTRQANRWFLVLLLLPL